LFNVDVGAFEFNSVARSGDTDSFSLKAELCVMPIIFSKILFKCITMHATTLYVSMLAFNDIVLKLDGQRCFY
jgi:hypothetical protein